MKNSSAIEGCSTEKRAEKVRRVRRSPAPVEFAMTETGRLVTCNP
jgi:hypothetical protein